MGGLLAGWYSEVSGDRGWGRMRCSIFQSTWARGHYEQDDDRQYDGRIQPRPDLPATTISASLRQHLVGVGRIAHLFHRCQELLACSGGGASSFNTGFAAQATSASLINSVISAVPIFTLWNLPRRSRVSKSRVKQEPLVCGLGFAANK
jgi:hypothetical protein